MSTVTIKTECRSTIIYAKGHNLLDAIYNLEKVFKNHMDSNPQIRQATYTNISITLKQ